MPILTQSQLLKGLTSALSLGDTVFTVMDRVKPFLIALSPANSEARAPFRIFIWNITHGGKSRSESEFRIQVTPAMPTPSPSELVVVLGWNEELSVYAAWDPASHSERHSTSPSLQVSLGTLREASSRGIAAEVRGSGDSVLAFHPDLLEFYLDSADLLHSLPIDELVSLVASVGRIGFEDSASRSESTTRSAVQRTVLGRYRDATFSSRVRKAYGYSCAICGKQLAMTEAAHIVPVAVEGSTDETSNGISLCRNHHHAFDQGLIVIEDDYSIRIAQNRVRTLHEQRQLGGLDDLLPGGVGSLVILPREATDRPRLDYLARGRSVRGLDQ